MPFCCQVRILRTVIPIDSPPRGSGIDSPAILDVDSFVFCRPGFFRQGVKGWKSYPMGDGLHRCSLSMATRPQPSQTNFIAVSLPLHMWPWLTSGVPQNEHFWRSSQGLQRWPGSLATAPQLLQVWAIFSLLFIYGLFTRGLPASSP